MLQKYSDNMINTVCELKYVHLLCLQEKQERLYILISQRPDVRRPSGTVVIICNTTELTDQNTVFSHLQFSQFIHDKHIIKDLPVSERRALSCLKGIHYPVKYFHCRRYHNTNP